MFFHRATERVAEGFYYASIVGPVGVVEGETFAAVTVVELNRRLDTVYPEARKVKSGDFAGTTSEKVGTACVRRIPVSYRKKDPLARAERLAAEEPIAAAVLHAGSLDVPGPVADVEMEPRVKKRSSRRGNKLDVEILAGADNAVREFSHAAESADNGVGLVLTVVDADIIVGTMLRAGTDGAHGAGHDVLAPLTVDVEFLVLDVKLYEWQPSVKSVFAVESAGIDAGVSRALDVTGLETTVLENAFAVASGHNFTAPIRVELGVLSVSEVDFELLLGSRVEAEVCLVGEIVGVKKYADETCLRNKGLRLFRFPAKYPWVFSVAHFGLSVAIDNLKQNDRENIIHVKINHIPICFIHDSLSPKIERVEFKFLYDNYRQLYRTRRVRRADHFAD